MGIYHCADLMTVAFVDRPHAPTMKKTQPVSCRKATSCAILSVPSASGCWWGYIEESLLVWSETCKAGGPEPHAPTVGRTAFLTLVHEWLLFFLLSHCRCTSPVCRHGTARFSFESLNSRKQLLQALPQWKTTALAVDVDRG